MKAEFYLSRQVPTEKNLRFTYSSNKPDTWAKNYSSWVQQCSKAFTH